MKTILALWLMTVAVIGDLDAWNNGTNANVRVGGIVANSFTNVARTAGTFVVAGADKSDVSTATSAMLAATLTDETGSGKVVFDTAPTFNTSITLTNASNSTVPLTINHASGGTTDIIDINVGGVTKTYVDNLGRWISTGGMNLLKSNFGIDMKYYYGGCVLGKDACFGFSSGNVDGTAQDVYIQRFGANSIQFGADAASPSAQTLKAANGSGTDKNGASLTIEGGQSTGTGRAGSLILKTGTTSTTGSSLNAYQERARYVPKYVDLTDNTATTLFTVALPATNSVGIQFVCTIQASDGTDFQSLTTPVTVDAVAKTTAITAVVAPTAAQTAVAASSAATLSVTYTVVDAGSNVLAVKVTADTSFSSTTYLRAKLVMTAINGMGAGWSITEI